MDQNKEVVLAEVISNESSQSLGSIELTPDLKVENIFKQVQEFFTETERGFEDVEIISEGNKKEINLNPYKKKTLRDLGVACNCECGYKIKVIMQKQNMSLDQEIADHDLQLRSSPSPTEAHNFNRDLVPSSTSDVEYGTSTQKQPTFDVIKYVGLVNQAMTCYLNSLLQALYMTPEFRNALYNWEFDGQNETRSIPFQLQKLFLNLQTSSKSAVETTDLTTSFGWQGSDAWQQHDIQELCRVMFDALEQKFKDTKQAKLINDLYEGKMLDYVRCLECSTEKSREDTFLDIPLPVRPFGSQVAYNSVEEALRAFVQPEILDGNNQYFCEKCNKKCDAHKGLKFTKFPYLLTLHLKRFDFDYNTFHRIKLNDKVVFPEKLNLNSFISCTKITESEYIFEEKDIISRSDDCCTTDSGSALEDEGCQSTDASSTANGQDLNCSESDEGIDVSSCRNLEMEPQGPYIYDLYSIMIHSGSASGGHYYAYIKDFDKHQWYCFNDQCVTRITEDDIKKTYGGSPHRGYFSGAYSSSTNAYMLMYRQVDESRNVRAIGTDDLPPHLINLLKQMKEKEEIARINKEKEDDFVKINIFCYHPVEKRIVDSKVAVLMDNTLQDIVQYTVHQKFKLEGVVGKDDCRLVRYNKFQKCIDHSFESDQVQFCEIDSNINLSMSDWFLEIKQPNAEWSVYKAGAVNMRVYPLNLHTEELDDPKTIRVDVNDTARDIKNRISVILGWSSDSIQLAMEKMGNLIYFENEEQVVDIDPNNIEYKLYVGNAIDENQEKSFHCKFRKFIEKIRQVIEMKIFIPDVSLGTLETLCIPTLNQNQNLNKLCIGAGNRTLPCCEGLCDQSNSEDSSLSDSDRTLVADIPGDGMGLSTSSGSSDDQHMASASDPTEDCYNHEVSANPAEEMNWDDHEIEQTQQMNHFYFKMVYIKPNECVKYHQFTRICKILVDKRITLEKLKKRMEPYVSVPVNYFEIFRQPTNPSNPSEDEWYKLTDTFRCTKDDVLSIKLGRVLQENECYAKIFLLRPNHEEPVSFLMDFIIAKGQTVGYVLKEIVHTAKKKYNSDLNLQKCRLREKSLKQVKKVYLEHQVFGEDILMISNNMEMFLQELEEPEKVVSSNQFVLFVRRWRPSLLSLEPIQELILNTSSVAELKDNIFQLSGIPPDHCEVALGNKCIPGDMHRLEVNNLGWKTSAEDIDGHPFYASDGSVFYYRDNREPLKVLSVEEKKLINLEENKRLGVQNSMKNYSPGKERALKIYVDTSPPKKNFDG